MDVGGVLGEAWSLYKRFLGRFFMTALIVYAVLDLFSALVDRAAGDSWVAALFWGLVAALFSVVGYFWVQAALVETVNDVRDGRADRSIGETYSAVRPRLAHVSVAVHSLDAALPLGRHWREPAPCRCARSARAAGRSLHAAGKIACGH